MKWNVMKGGDNMFCCEKCGNSDACERTDLKNDPVLCEECYSLEIYGDVNCDHCSNSYSCGDKIRCKVGICKPVYDT